MLRKVCRQKDSCSLFQVIKFSWAWITLYLCRQRSIVRFSVVFLEKREDVFETKHYFHKQCVSSNLFGLPFKHDYSSFNRKWVIVWGGESALLTVLHCWFYRCWLERPQFIYISYWSYFNILDICAIPHTSMIEGEIVIFSPF